MSRFVRLVILYIPIFCCLTTALAEENSGLVLPHPIEFRLEETARKLQLSPERLLLARKALREGTRLGIEGLVDANQFGNFSLLQLWERVDPDNAGAAYEFHLGLMRETASTGDERSFLWATRLAPHLIARLAKYDPPEVLHYMSWPAAPTAEAKTSDEVKFFRDKVVRDYVREIAHQDPDRALEELDRIRLESGELTLDSSVRAAIAKQFQEQGKKAEAIQLIQETYTDFEQEALTSPVVLEDFRLALGGTQSISQELFLEGFEILKKKLQLVPPGQDSRTYELIGNDRTEVVEVDRSEFVLLNALKFNRSHPEITDQIVEDDPELKELTERIDFHSFRRSAPAPECPGYPGAEIGEAMKNFLADARRRNRMSSPMQSSVELPDHPSAPRSVASSYPETRHRSPTLTVPGSMHNRLEKQFASLEHFDDLIYLASLGGVDRKTRLEALRVAREILHDQQSQPVRGCLVMKLLSPWRGLDPEGHQAVHRDALAVLDELTDVQAGSFDEAEKLRIRRILTLLRSTIVKDWALIDFEETMQFIRELPVIERYLCYSSAVHALSFWRY